jgi:hypothetical protein
MPNYPEQLLIDKNRSVLLEPSILLLSFKKAISPERIAALLKGLRMEVVNNPGADHVKGPLINNTDTRTWIRTIDGAAVTEDQYQSLAKGFGENLEWIGAAYQLAESRRNVIFCPMPHALVIELKTLNIQNVAAPPDLAGGLKMPGQTALQIAEIPQRSAFLNGRHYYEIGNPMVWDAITVRNLILEQFGAQVANVYFDRMPLVSPLAFIPNDTYYASQWNLAKINAPQAWDITTGAAPVIVAILDSGCDLTHPDLSFVSQGVNCTSMAPPASPAASAGPDIGHGTCCAGIAGAIINNGQGVSGIAGSCQVLPLSIQSFADTELAFGINYAVSNGAAVISMSWGTTDSSIVDTALSAALAADVVLCAAAGNGGTPILYPASYPGVMAIGGTDQNDDYKTPASPDGECWSPSFGDGISVAAPCVQIWSTDIQGTGGFNNNGAAITTLPCVTHPSAGDAAGNYFEYFNGTSSATPHVSGFVALLRTQYPGLTGVQVRSIVERTADKVGTLAYAVNPTYPNGAWNNQLGYGRINLYQGLDFADVYIKDYPTDTGVEPRTPPGGDFWDFGDLVVRPTNDHYFNPSLVAQASTVVRGQTNYIYVRVTNNGPNTARNLSVSVRIAPFVGTQFVAGDWTTTDATHVQPTTITNTFATLAPGAEVIASFSIDAAQVETLYGWITDDPWHPCMLALVTADNDYAFANDIATGPYLAVQINNYAQRNLTVVAAGFQSEDGSFQTAFPFIAGHKLNTDTSLTLRIDRSGLPPKSVLYLSVDETGSAFPLVDFTLPAPAPGQQKDCGMEFLEKTTIRTKLGCCEGVLILEKGSRFTCCDGKTAPSTVKVTGGLVILQNGERLVRIDDPVATITLSKQPGQLIPLSLQLEVNGQLKKGDSGLVPISQLDQAGQVVGGAGWAFVVA